MQNWSLYSKLWCHWNNEKNWGWKYHLLRFWKNKYVSHYWEKANGREQDLRRIFEGKMDQLIIPIISSSQCAIHLTAGCLVTWWLSGTVTSTLMEQESVHVILVSFFRLRWLSGLSGRALLVLGRKAGHQVTVPPLPHLGWGSWESYLTLASLSFLICTMEIPLVPTSQNCHESCMRSCK